MTPNRKQSIIGLDSAEDRLWAETLWDKFEQGDLVSLDRMLCEMAREAGVEVRVVANIQPALNIAKRRTLMTYDLVRIPTMRRMMRSADRVTENYFRPQIAGMIERLRWSIAAIASAIAV